MSQGRFSHLVLHSTALPKCVSCALLVTIRRFISRLIPNDEESLIDRRWLSPCYIRRRYVVGLFWAPHHLFGMHCSFSPSSLLIHELQTRGILTGDAAIAIFSTGVLALGLFGLSYWGGGITHTVEGYLFGNILLIYDDSLEIIVWMSLFSMAFLGIFRHVLLATAIDPISVQIQGIPVKRIGRTFSVVTAVVVVSMVQIYWGSLGYRPLGYSRCNFSDCIKELSIVPHMGAGIRTIIHSNRDLCLCGVKDWHGLHNSSNLGIYFSCSSTNSASHSS